MCLSSTEQQGKFFIIEVLSAFSFIMTDCNFEPPTIRRLRKGMSSDFTELRYESKAIFIEIFYAHMESELSLRMGLLKEIHDYDEYRQGFNLDEALLFSGKCNHPIRLCHPCSESDLKSEIIALASIVRSCLFDAICNPTIIAQWMESRKIISNESQNRETWLQKRKEAEDAWHKNDYERVISIYESFLNYLSKLEQKRLSYAKKCQEPSNLGDLS